MERIRVHRLSGLERPTDHKGRIGLCCDCSMRAETLFLLICIVVSCLSFVFSILFFFSVSLSLPTRERETEKKNTIRTTKDKHETNGGLSVSCMFFAIYTLQRRTTFVTSCSFTCRMKSSKRDLLLKKKFAHSERTQNENGNVSSSENVPIYSRTSVARILMARLPRLFRTRS